MTEEQDINEQLDEELNKLLGESKNDYGSPAPIKKDTILKFFREIIHSVDSTKVANVDKLELNRVRTLLKTANYAKVHHLETICHYLEDKAQIILATSMSKQGFLAQLFVTQIKKEQKIDKPTPQKKGLFAPKTPEGETP